MRRTFVLVLAGLLLAPTVATARGATRHADRIVERPDLQRHFTARGTVGTMVVKQSGHPARTVVVGSARSRTRYLPSSTFKIPNSLIAIDTGVASGAQQSYPGPNPNYLVAGSPFLPAVCEDDLTLRSAFASSCIPIYQHIARDVGLPAYRSALRAMRYGNRRIGSAPVDSFWLEGSLAISAREQDGFLERLRRGRLPVSGYAMSEVRSMMVVDGGAGFVLRAKTGYVFSTVPARGWWVGWVQRPGLVSTFALNLDITTPAHAAARVEIGTEILAALGAFGD
jgi:beta-lactamase class D